MRQEVNKQNDTVEKTNRKNLCICGIGEREEEQRKGPGLGREEARAEPPSDMRRGPYF